MKQATSLCLLATLLSFGSVSAQSTMAELTAASGDTIMLHRLADDEIWGSFIITDQLAESFNDNELIVLQVDQNKPIKLEHQKQCGGAKGESQQVSFDFDYDDHDSAWLFNKSTSNNPDILKLAGWDKATFEHMRADRRPEVVDFAIVGELAPAGLWQQFTRGQQLTFRYTTESGQTRQAVFDLRLIQQAL